MAHLRRPGVSRPIFLELRFCYVEHPSSSCPKHHKPRNPPVTVLGQHEPETLRCSKALLISLRASLEVQMQQNAKLKARACPTASPRSIRIQDATTNAACCLRSCPKRVHMQKARRYQGWAQRTTPCPLCDQGPTYIDVQHDPASHPKLICIRVCRTAAAPSSE